MEQENLNKEFPLKMAILASFASFFVYDIFYLVVFQTILSLPFIIVSTFLILDVLTYILFRKKLYNLARWSILVLLVLTIFCLAFYALGPESGVHYYFLAWSIIPLVVFTFRRIIFWILYATINISLFIWVEIFLGEIETSFLLPENIVIPFKVISIFFAMCVISFTLWILYISLQRKEKTLVIQALELKDLNEDLQKKNNKIKNNEVKLQDINHLLEDHLKTMKKQQEQLINANASKDKLFSIIAHDLRSPFNSILGFSEILIDNIENFEVKKTEEYIGYINLSAQNTLSLLENLLNWAKTQTGRIVIQPKKIILSSIIQETINISNASAKTKNISLNHIQSDDVEVFTDGNMLKTVLRNLVSNAIKFTHAGGKIDVSAISKQDKVEISISDNGVGMNEETRKKLFNVNTNITTHGTENESGSGLGLVLCKEFVERLDGSIWVESEEGKGSDFKFTIPKGLDKINNDL